MNKKILFLATSILFLAASCCKAPVVAERWSAERANQWMADKGWIVGCDYVPSTAINQIEMWQAETFDPETIDRELGFAEGLGFNTVRIFFSNLVYTADPCGIQGAFLSVPGAVRQARDPGAADLLDERGKMYRSASGQTTRCRTREPQLAMGDDPRRRLCE